MIKHYETIWSSWVHKTKVRWRLLCLCAQRQIKGSRHNFFFYVSNLSLPHGQRQDEEQHRGTGFSLKCTGDMIGRHSTACRKSLAENRCCQTTSSEVSQWSIVRRQIALRLSHGMSCEALFLPVCQGPLQSKWIISPRRLPFICHWGHSVTLEDHGFPIISVCIMCNCGQCYHS